MSSLPKRIRRVPSKKACSYQTCEMSNDLPRSPSPLTPKKLPTAGSLIPPALTRTLQPRCRFRLPDPAVVSGRRPVRYRNFPKPDPLGDACSGRRAHFAGKYSWPRFRGSGPSAPAGCATETRVGQPRHPFRTSPRLAVPRRTSAFRLPFRPVERYLQPLADDGSFGPVLPSHRIPAGIQNQNRIRLCVQCDSSCFPFSDPFRILRYSNYLYRRCSWPD